MNTCEYYITLGLHSSSYSRQWSLVLYFDAEERCTSGLQGLGLCTMSCSLKLLLLLLSGHFGKNNARTNVLQKIAESILVNLVNLCSRPPVVSAPCSTSKLVHNLRHAKTRALLGLCVKSTCYALPTLGTSWHWLRWSFSPRGPTIPGLSSACTATATATASCHVQKQKMHCRTNGTGTVCR